MIKNYYKPTPAKWRKIGDSILYGCGAIGATGLFELNGYLAANNFTIRFP